MPFDVRPRNVKLNLSNEIQTRPCSSLSSFKLLNRCLVQFELYALSVTFADFCLWKQSFERIQRVLF